MPVAELTAAFLLSLLGGLHCAGMCGGFIGMLAVAFKRASFANEAGLGSAPIAHATARTDDPVREGTLALLEPFFAAMIAQDSELDARVHLRGDLREKGVILPHPSELESSRFRRATRSRFPRVGSVHGPLIQAQPGPLPMAYRPRMATDAPRTRAHGVTCAQRAVIAFSTGSNAQVADAHDAHAKHATQTHAGGPSAARGEQRARAAHEAAFGLQIPAGSAASAALGPSQTRGRRGHRPAPVAHRVI